MFFRYLWCGTWANTIIHSMCGISGFIGMGEASDLALMTQSLLHRGPDGMGLYVDAQARVFLGHRRLSIVDLQSGSQPMSTTDGAATIVFNGQIYNAEELRETLIACGRRFQSKNSDTEVLLHAYLEWGKECVQRLNGMWAFAIYDRKHKQIFLSRDRFGEKPLYYTWQNGVFAFASEIKALLTQRKLRFTPSTLGIKKYLTHGFFPGESSFYQEIKKIPAGHSLVFRLGENSLALERYWEYRIEPEFDKEESYWSEKIHACLDAAVRIRMRADVPIGLMLSGGVDSSAIAYFAQKRSERALPSFSIAFEEKNLDETEWALQASKQIGTAHSSVLFDAKKLPAVLEEMFAKLDCPLSDSSMLSYFLLSQFIGKSVKVALGGDAGDELFAGYDTFRAFRICEKIRRHAPAMLHPGILAALGALPLSRFSPSAGFQLQRLLRGIGNKPALWNILWLSPLSSGEVEEILHSPADLEELYSETISAWENSSARDPFDRALEFYGKIFLPGQILTKVDSLGMMNGVEVRSPFLDIDLVDCARRIPNHLKLRGINQTKYILKKSLARAFSPQFLARKKLGLSAPLGKWFRDSELSISDPDFSFASPGWKEKKISLHQSGKIDQRILLWNIFSLEKYSALHTSARL